MNYFFFSIISDALILTKLSGFIDGIKLRKQFFSPFTIRLRNSSPNAM